MTRKHICSLSVSIGPKLRAGIILIVVTLIYLSFFISISLFFSLCYKDNCCHFSLVSLSYGFMFCSSVIHNDGVYHVILDQKPFIKGHLLEDLTPPIVEPKEIDDPEDEMPEDWDEREK